MATHVMNTAIGNHMSTNVTPEKSSSARAVSGWMPSRARATAANCAVQLTIPSVTATSPAPRDTPDRSPVSRSRTRISWATYVVKTSRASNASVPMPRPTQ